MKNDNYMTRAHLHFVVHPQLDAIAYCCKGLEHAQEMVHKYLLDEMENLNLPEIKRIEIKNILAGVESSIKKAHSELFTTRGRLLYIESELSK